VITLPRLRHGGIMPNYACPAACKHCLYACLPHREGYMTPKKMDEVCATLRRGGCNSVHIGGGEPFMNFEGLCALLETARKHGISVEYVETNAYWATSDALIEQYLNALARAGVNALCISGDAYHAEFIDPALPKQLAEACRRTGFGFFLWSTDLRRLRFNGRAITLEEANFPFKPWTAILQEAENKPPCKNLTSTDHFHVDMDGNFIPAGCTGFILPLHEALEGLPQGKYPAFEASYHGGLSALITLAEKHGFAPRGEGYSSTCNACFHVRKYLSALPNYPELDATHYMNAY